MVQKWSTGVFAPKSFRPHLCTIRTAPRKVYIQQGIMLVINDRFRPAASCPMTGTHDSVPVMGHLERKPLREPFQAVEIARQYVAASREAFEDVVFEAVKQLDDSGASQRQIARELDLSKSAVNRILRSGRPAKTVSTFFPERGSKRIIADCWNLPWESAGRLDCCPEQQGGSLNTEPEPRLIAKARERLTDLVSEAWDHATDLLPPRDDEAVVVEHFEYLHWPDHDVYAQYVTVGLGPGERPLTGVLAAASLAELADYRARVSEQVRAIGSHLTVPKGSQGTLRHSRR